MSGWGGYVEHNEIMEIAHLTGKSFCVHDVVNNTLLSLDQEQDDGSDPIVIRLSNSNDKVKAHYNLL